MSGTQLGSFVVVADKQKSSIQEQQTNNDFLVSCTSCVYNIAKSLDNQITGY